MCLPLCILKFQMYVGGTVHIIIGIAGIVAAIVLNGVDKDLIPDEQEGNVKTAYLGTLIFGIVVLISGFMGIFGGMKKQKCLILMFVIITILFWVISLALAGVVQFGQNFFKGEVFDKCDTFFTNEQQELNQAKKYFCDNKEAHYCPCYMEDEVFIRDYVGNLNVPENVVSSIQQTKRSQITGDILTRGYSDFLDCKTFFEEQQKLDDQIKITVNWSEIEQYHSFFNKIETEFQCSGLCVKEPLYFFSNSNNGLPKSYTDGNGCYKDIFQELIDLMNQISVPLWIFVAFFTLNFLFGCCLLYHPKKDEYYNQDSTPSAKSEVYK